MNVLITLFFLLFIFTINISFAEDNNEICKIITNKVEKKLKLPQKLLTSISLVETGRVTKNKHYTWPWSANVEGQSYYFNNKESMIKFLKIKIQNKITNFDVGCMQINYKYHIKKESNLELFVDPNYNVNWAGIFLKELYKKHKSWNKAISRYHSSNKLRMKSYLKKVYQIWNNQRQLRDKLLSNNLIERKNIHGDKNIYFSKSFYSKNKKKIDLFRKEFLKSSKFF